MAAITLAGGLKVEITLSGILRFTNPDGSTADIPLPIRSGADGVTPVFVSGKVETLPVGSDLRIVTRSAGRPNTYQIDFSVPAASGSGSGTPGAPGRSVNGVTISASGTTGTATVTYSDNTTSTSTFTLPAGPKGDAASATTVYADLDASGNTLPFTRSTLERNRDGSLSVMNWIAASKRTAIQNNTHTGDLQPEIQAALNSGENIGLNAGTYPIFAPLTMPTGQIGQKLVGTAERNDVIISLPSGYALGGNAVLKAAQYATLANFTFDCYQPGRSGSTVPASNAIIHYPWLIDLSGTTRGRIDNITMQAGWDGIYCGGNAGGCNFGRIEDGTLNRGIYVDNPLDFFTIESWESWVYGFAGTGLETWSYSNPGSLQFMAADGLNVDNINLWKKGILYANPSELSATFGIVKLDGGNALFKATAGRVIIGSLNSLTDVLLPSVENAGARVVIGQIDLKMAAAASDPPSVLLKNTSGTMIVTGGVILHNSTYREVEVAGGLLCMANVEFTGPTAKAKALGRVYQSGGRLMLKNCAFSDDTGTGPAVYLTTNDAGHSVAGNYLGGRGIRQPASPNGYFAGNVGGAVTTF